MDSVREILSDDRDCGDLDATADEIPWCKRVRETDYSGRNLEDIPEVVFDCSALCTLDVSK